MVPKSDEGTAIAFYTGTLQVFVYAAMIEYTAVLRLVKIQTREKWTAKIQAKKIGAMANEKKFEDEEAVLSYKIAIWDRFAIVFYFTMLILFNLGFFFYYLIVAK